MAREVTLLEENLLLSFFLNQYSFELHSKYIFLHTKINVALIAHERNLFFFLPYFFWATDGDYYRDPQLV